MASIIEGYSCDIFISYRQKDNKYDGWVTEFVDNLKKELEATFKEEISVYFDINPHDGLLETHDVDASLKDRLKCLVFIPIISRTYCDPKSFAWEHEFKAFVEHASQDQYGLKVKMPNGNVASRVLPIRIYDLDNADIKLCESVLGGVLRGLEFIYSEPGVNRPLKPKDNEEKNLNDTSYRNQINKVGNAIKEILSGLKTEPIRLDQEKIQHREPLEEVKKEDERKELFSTKIFYQKSKRLLIVFMVAFLCIIGAFIIFKILIGRATLEKSIAVLPFVSPADTNTYLINSVRDEVNNNLQTIKDLRIVSQYSADKYRDQSKYSLREIAKELDVNYLVAGKGQKYGTTLSLTVELIEAINDRILWSRPYKQEIRRPEDFSRIQSQIAQDILRALSAIITPEEKQLIEKIPTSNIDALYFYQKGNEELRKYIPGRTNRLNPQLEINNRQVLQRVYKHFKKALEYDSTFALAYTGLARISLITYKWDSVRILCDKALSYDRQVDEAYIIRGNLYGGNKNYAIEEYNKALKINPNSWEAYYQKGIADQWEDLLNSIDNIQHASKLNHGSELPDILYDLSRAYRNAGFYDKSKEIALEVLKLDFDSVRYYSHLHTANLWNGNNREAFECLGKAYSVDSTNQTILMQLAEYYLLVNQLEESLKYFKKYFAAFPQGPDAGNYKFGYVLWKLGYKKEAEDQFDNCMKYCESLLKSSPKLSDYQSFVIHNTLASAYAFIGDKEKVYENLKIGFAAQKMPANRVIVLTHNHCFDDIRNEPEFQKIVSEVEVKFQEEHERIRKGLKEGGLL